MATSLCTQGPTDAAFQRLTADVQSELEIAMLNLLPQLAGACAKKCLDKMRAWLEELSKDRGLRGELWEGLLPDTLSSVAAQADGERPVLSFTLDDSDGEDAKGQAAPVAAVSREASTAFGASFATDHSEPVPLGMPLATNHSEPEGGWQPSTAGSPQQQEASLEEASLEEASLEEASLEEASLEEASPEEASPEEASPERQPAHTADESDTEWRGCAADEGGADAEADNADESMDHAAEEAPEDSPGRAADGREDDREDITAASTEEEATACEAVATRVGCLGEDDGEDIPAASEEEATAYEAVATRVGCLDEDDGEDIPAASREEEATACEAVATRVGCLDEDEDDGEGSPAASAEESAVACKAVASRAGCRRLLRSLSASLAATALQQKLSGCRGNDGDWGRWPSADVLTGNAAMRKVQISAWRDLGIATVERAHSNLLRHCAPEELNPVLGYLNLLVHEGPLERVVVERLEVAWALGAYPSHVSLLVECGREELANLQALRRKINQTLEMQTTPSSDNLSFAAPWTMAPQGVPELREWSEEELVGVGCRAVELLSSQEVLNAASARLGGRQHCVDVHRNLIAAGACGPEQILCELRATTEAELPPTAAKCRLNATLQCMGLGLLSSQVALVLRSIAKEHCGMTNLRVSSASRNDTSSTCGLLVTAPHNIVLPRKGKPPQPQQDFTTCIAERLAERLAGMSLTWSRHVQYRTELRWAAVKRRGQCGLLGNASGLLDTGTTDPHALPKSPQNLSEWHQQMAVVLQEFHAKRKFHVDVHGCPDPPKRAAHLVIGLGALAQHYPLKLVKEFGDRLENDLGGVLQQLQLPPGKRVCVVIPEDPSNPPALSGAWREKKPEQTQTQWAMSCGFAVAVQLEMSSSLRRLFGNGSRRACEGFATVLVGSLTRSEEADALATQRR